MDRKKVIITRKQKNTTETNTNENNNFITNITILNSTQIIQQPQQPQQSQQPQELQQIETVNNTDQLTQNAQFTQITQITQITHFKQNKLNFNKSILLIDTSYWVYYRFFALRNWYQRANPNLNISFETYNWIEDKTFIAQYTKLFLEAIHTIALKKNIPMSNIVFCIDCSYKEIWRYELKADYKGTRLDTHKRNSFNSFEIFKIVKDTIIPRLQDKYKMSAVYVNKCEADDVIGNLSPFLCGKLIYECSTIESNAIESNAIESNTIESNAIESNNSKPKIYILASDNDYIQICTNNIILIDGNCKQLCSEKKSKGGDNYLIRKILTGDVSDNIEACFVLSNIVKTGINTPILDTLALDANNLDANNLDYKKCTPSIIEKLMTCESTYNYFNNLLTSLRNSRCNDVINKCDVCNDYDYMKNVGNVGNTGNVGNVGNDKIIKNNQFVKNAILMDFKMLPKYLKTELDTIFANF